MIKRLLIICVVITSILFLWKNIIFNFNTHLPGWLDELFIIWIYQNNVHHFTSLDFNNLYETNAIYPFKYTLSFAEHMYFPSFLILIINLFTKNIIAQYNILLVLNHVLIFLTALLFFKKVFKNFYAGAISAFYISFSPYFFTKMSHFQMIFLWPMFLSLYFLADYFEKEKGKSLIFSGILTGIQFLSSVYLGIMNLIIVLIWFLTKAIFLKNDYKRILKSSVIFISLFLIISSISLYGYILVDLEYQAKRDYGDYVTYSANLTDYLFPTSSQSSYLYTTSIFQKIKRFNHHMIGESAVFAGIIPLVFATFLLVPKIKRSKGEININLIFSPLITLSLVLILVGFILSLGPRLWVNGQYSEIPLPSDLLLKIFPPIGIIRAVARWHLLVILGFSILLGLGYIKVEKKLCKNLEIRKTLFLIVILFGLFLEFYSLKPISASAQSWNDSSYKFLSSNICKDSSNILLEYPFHYRNLDADIVKDVNYMAKILLSSTVHNCKILSGYYGYEPPKYIEMRKEFANGFDYKDIKIIKDLKINYIKFNKYAISNLEYQKTKDKLNQFINIYEDENVLILKVN